MILPTEIRSRHKIRDARILSLYASGSFNQEFIAKKFNLTQARINQILKLNATLVLQHSDWEKLQRINLIKNDLEKSDFKNQVLTKKDAIELWRKEIEGDGKETTINNVTYNINGSRKNSRFEILPSQSTADNS